MKPNSSPLPACPGRAIPAAMRRKPLERLDAEYEFCVVNPHPRRDGPQEDELNILEIRIAPDGYFVRDQWGPDWYFQTWTSAMDLGAEFEKAHDAGFRDGQLEVLSRSGVGPKAVPSRSDIVPGASPQAGKL